MVSIPGSMLAGSVLLQAVVGAFHMREGDRLSSASAGVVSFNGDVPIKEASAIARQPMHANPN